MKYTNNKKEFYTLDELKEHIDWLEEPELEQINEIGVYPIIQGLIYNKKNDGIWHCKICKKDCSIDGNSAGYYSICFLHYGPDKIKAVCHNCSQGYRDLDDLLCEMISKKYPFLESMILDVNNHDATFLSIYQRLLSNIMPRLELIKVNYNISHDIIEKSVRREFESHHGGWLTDYKFDWGNGGKLTIEFNREKRIYKMHQVIKDFKNYFADYTINFIDLFNTPIK